MSRPSNPLVWLLRHLALAIAALMAGCTPVAEPLVSAGLDSDDEVLRSYLSRLYSQASAAPSSGALRGELAMAYAANDYPAAAKLTYVQAQALEPEEPRWPYLLALLHAESGDSEQALVQMDRALELDPSYAPAWLARGTYLLDADQADEAETAFDEAARLGAGPIASLSLARTYLNQGRNRDAIAVLEPMVAEYPHPMAYRLLGRALQTVGRGDEAEAARLKGRGAAPWAWSDERKSEESSHVRRFAGLLQAAQRLLAQGQTREAARILEGLLERQPDNEVALNTLSSAYARGGDRGRAIELLEHTIELHPESFAAHLNLANHLDREGAYERALQHVRRAVNISPDLSAAREMMGELLLRGEQDDEALTEFVKARSPLGYYYAGVIHGARENWGESVRNFERALELEPTDVRAMLFLAQSLGESGRYDEARASIERAQRFGASTEDVAAALARLEELVRAKSAGARE
jgi:tetratricopeptide (TPR) repeat protein